MHIIDLGVAFAAPFLPQISAPPMPPPPPPVVVEIGTPLVIAAPARPACRGDVVVTWGEVPGCILRPGQALLVRVPRTLGTVANAVTWCEANGGNGGLRESALDAWCELDY